MTASLDPLFYIVTDTDKLIPLVVSVLPKEKRDEISKMNQSQIDDLIKKIELANLELMCWEYRKK